MNRLSLAAVLALAIICLLSASALADSFTFTGGGTLGFGNDSFFLSGPSINLHSDAPCCGPNGTFNECPNGSACKTFPQQIFVFASLPPNPGEFSGGTLGGITAYSLGFDGGLFFSNSIIKLSSDPNNLGTGPVTFTGDIRGFVFLPLGCEKTFTCTEQGPEVFHIHLRGTGTVTASGEIFTESTDITRLDYNFHGVATTTPEPSSLLLVGSGLAGLAGLSRWRLRRR
jgi:PEP-CTERM motif